MLVTLDLGFSDLRAYPIGTALVMQAPRTLHSLEIHWSPWRVTIRVRVWVPVRLLTLQVRCSTVAGYGEVTVQVNVADPLAPVWSVTVTSTESMPTVVAVPEISPEEGSVKRPAGSLLAE